LEYINLQLSGPIGFIYPSIIDIFQKMFCKQIKHQNKCLPMNKCHNNTHYIRHQW